MINRLPSKVVNIFFLLFLSSFTSIFSQCPEITSSSLTGPCFNGGTPCDLCPGATITLKAGGTDLVNNGCVDWYYSDDQNFNPYNAGEGTFIACGKITTTYPPFCTVCPTILGIMVDACGTEAQNEFMLLSSGSGFNLNSLQVDFAIQNNTMGAVNNDINIGASPCNWKTPDPALMALILGSANCNSGNVIAVSPGGSVPANAIVVVFTSGNANTNYDFSALCATGQKIYVVQSGCNRNVGAFTNASGTGPRTTTISLLGCSCSNSLTYTCEDLAPAQDGDYVLGDGTIGNDGCKAPVVTAPLVMSTSTVADVMFTVTTAMCNMGPYFIKGILNPAADILCGEKFTNTFQFNVVCPTASITKQGPACWGGNLNLEGMGGGTYKWSGPNGFTSMLQNPVVTNLTNLKAGTYFLTVTNTAGCTDVASIAVNVNPDITLSITPPNPEFCQGENVLLSGSATGGSGTYSYEWTVPGGGTTTGQTLVANVAGTYTLVVTDSEGCSKSKSVNVVQNPTPNVNITPNPANVCQGGTILITASASGGTPGYGYSWNTGANTPSITVGAGTNMCTVTDSKGCKGIGTITVNTFSPITITFSPDPLILCDGGTANLTANPSGGNGNFSSFAWTTPSGPKTGATISVTQSGNYVVTVTDGAGCTGVATKNIIKNPPLVVKINPDPASFCSGSSVQLTASSTGGSGNGYTFSWSTPGGNASGASINATLAGVYTVTATDSEGCTGTANVNVSVSPDLVASISPNPANFCPGGSANLKADVTGGIGPFTYNWTTPSGNKTGQNIVATVAGVYFVTITDALSCTGTAQVNVIENANLTVSILPVSPSFCPGSFVNISASANGGSGVYTYSWSTPSGSKSGQNIQASVAGNYQVTVTDSKGCSGMATINVVESAGFPVGISPPNPSFCAGSSVDLTATANGGNGTYSYTWSTPSGTQTGQTIKAGIVGTYQVTVTDSNGCSGIAQIVVIESATIPVNILPAAPSFCPGESVDLTVNASGTIISYNWTTPKGANTGSTLKADMAGVYSVTVTDAGGCTGTSSINVSENPAKIVSIAPINPSFCIGGNVILTANTTGTNLSFSWNTPSGNQTGNPITANVAGIYSVTVTEVGACSGSINVQVDEVQALTVEINPKPASFCTNGSVTLTANALNGVAPFTYSWSTPIGPGTNMTFKASQVGDYSVTITDSKGCTGTTLIPVTQSNSLIIIFDPIPPGFCPGKTIDLSTKPLGGQSPYSYKWNSPLGVSTNAIINTGTAGNYQVTVTDSNGCSGLGEVIVEEFNAPNIDLPAAPGFCPGKDIPIDATITDISPPYLYNWVTPSGNFSTKGITASVSGVYNLTVTNAKSCSTSKSLNVIQWQSPIAEILPDPVLFCKNSSATVSANPSGGTAPYSFLWTGPSLNATTNSIQVVTAGIYTLLVTDIHACTADYSFPAAEQNGLSVTLTTDPPVLCGIPQFMVLSSVNGGNQPYSYNWDTPSGIQTTNAALGSLSGLYSVTVTDKEGCTGEAKLIVTNSPINIDVTSNDPSCKNAIGGSINLVFPSNVEFPVSIKLNNDNPIQNNFPLFEIKGLGAGTYELTITDSNGCSQSNTVTLNPLPELNLNVGQDVTIYAGETHTINPIANFNIDSIIWDNKQSLVCEPLCLSPVAGPTTTTTYKAVAFDENGCSATDEITINVLEKTSVYVPNTFSPDGNGINDKWVIFADNTVKQIKTLYIYDRWGESILQQENFPPNDYDYGWNGKFRNKPMDAGVFVYYFVVEFENGKTKVFKGDITILGKK